MKKLLLSTALLALTTGAALAADLPSRKAEPLPPPPPPPPMWTGIYAGLNAGYGFGTNSNTISANSNAIWDGPAYDFVAGGPLALSSNQAGSQSGFIGGGQIGYNYQWGQNFVIGIEADMQGTGIRGTSRGGLAVAPVSTNAAGTFNTAANAVGGTQVQAGVDWMGTVRGRLGYLFTPTMLLYATGGLTYGGVHANVQQVAIEQPIENPGAFNYGTTTWLGGGQQSKTLVGWNVGGGLEWMFMPNWSLKAEGIYWNMGNSSFATFASAPNPNLTGAILGPDPAATIGRTTVNYQGVIARMGVNYHFNFGGSAPIVAKY